MKILTVPNRMLYRLAVPVKVFGPKLQTLIDKMFFIMYQYRGIGLAANQVGILKQIVVLNIRHAPMVLINPVAYDMHNGRIRGTESCLSVPNYAASIERANYIQVRSMDRHGKKQNFEASGLLARVVLHETEHLQGILITSHVRKNL